MTAADVFLHKGNLRSIWRFFLALVLILLAFSFVSPLARQLSQHVLGTTVWYRLFFFGAVLELLILLGIFKLMTQVFERKPLGVVGLAFHPSCMKELCTGLGIGGIMIGVVGLAEGLLRVAQFAHSPLPARVLLAGGSLWFVLLVVAAANEELLFRGYLFQRLAESVGPVGAIVVTSAFFGLAHLANAHHTWISTANTMLVGVTFSIAYLRTRSLWMPVGMHFIWNYVQSFVLGLPVSGLLFPSSLLIVRVRGATWLTGSGYGPEGGILCTAVVAGAAVYLLVSPRIKISEKMKMLVFGPPMESVASEEGQVLPGLGRDENGPT